MLAMRYAVPFPRDYDMSVARARIGAVAASLDEAPGLLFAAHGLRERDVRGARTNEYAPVFVWSNTSRMADYLWGAGSFTDLTVEFGRPRVEVWPVATVQLDRSTLDKADTLVVTHGPAADGSLRAVADALVADCDKAMRGRSHHAAVRACDVATGAAISIDLQRGLPRSDDGAVYDLVHLNLPTPPAPPRP